MQFWALTRPHAELVAWEEPLFAAFREHCISTWGKVPGCAFLNLALPLTLTPTLTLTLILNLAFTQTLTLKCMYLVLRPSESCYATV